MNRLARTLVVSLVIPVLAAASLLAQSSGGVFRGVINDQAGLAIPQAKVTIRSTSTGIEVSVLTSNDGLFTSPTVNPDDYLVTAEKQGFKKVVYGPVTLHVGQTLGVNLSLPVGTVTESVVVQASGRELTQSESAEISQVITSEAIKQMPLNGRVWQNLIGLSAGVTPGSPGQSGSPNAFNINGQRDKGNLVRADGISVTPSGSGRGNSYGAPLDAIQEFSIESNGYSAEYGNLAGGTINLKYKSGSNNWHGTLFEFFRNEALAANNYFANLSHKGKSPVQYNQFGGSFGGPIRKNKTFFFLDYQGGLNNYGNTFFSTVPTAAERQGDFSHSVGAAGAVLPIYDPTTGKQFQYNGVLNYIPNNRIDPVAQALVSKLPLPNQLDATGNPLPVNNYARTLTTNSFAHQFDVRIDHQFSEKNTIFGRYSYLNSETDTPCLFGKSLGGPPSQCGTSPMRRDNFVLGHTYLFTPTLFNEFRFGFNRSNGRQRQAAYGLTTAHDFGIPDVNKDANTGGLPQFAVGSLTFGGTTVAPLLTLANDWEFSEKVSWIKGRHSVRFGFDYAREYSNIFFYVFPTGLQTYLNLSTASSKNLKGSGSQLASFMIGDPFQVNRDRVDAPTHLRVVRYGMFVQDDIRAASRLTLNLGIRYDILPSYTEEHNRLANFDPATKTMIVAGTNGRRGLRNTDFLDVQPRIGFAYALTNDRKTTLRGGYGIAYADTVGAPGPGTTGERNIPFYYSSVLRNPLFAPPTYLLESSLPALTIPPASSPSGNVDYLPPNDRNPYSQLWNLSIQRALNKDTMVEIAYTGTKGTHLLVSGNINDPPPGSPNTIAQRQPFGASLGTIRNLSYIGASSYNGLQAKMEKRFSQGFYLLSTYTWSKTMDLQSTGTDSNSAGGSNPQNPNNWSAEWAPATFDRAHRFTFSGIWDLPYGRGHHFGANIPTALDVVLGGWQFSGIFTGQTGTPISARMSCADIGTTGDNCRPDRIKDGDLLVGLRTRTKWFDTSAFQIPNTPRYGSAGRDIIRIPGYSDVDFGLSKYFKIGHSESRRIQFRGEFFNALNHTNFGMPANGIDLANFGTITSAGSPRVIQLGVHAEF